MKETFLLFMALLVLGMIGFSTPPHPANYSVNHEYYATHAAHGLCHDTTFWNCAHVHIMKDCTDDCNFDPQYLIVEQGTRVEWGNHKGMRRIVALDGSFDSGHLQEIKKADPDHLRYKNGYWPNYDASHFSYVFYKPGHYTYVDTYSGTRGYVEVI